MSGRYITSVAAAFPHRMAAAASLYGVGIVTDQEDLPHLALNRIRGELYYAFAEHDQSVPANVIPDLKAALNNTDVKVDSGGIPRHASRVLLPGARGLRHAGVRDDVGEDLRSVGSPPEIARDSATVRFSVTLR